MKSVKVKVCCCSCDNRVARERACLMPSQLAPGQPVFQLQAAQALARAAEWGGKTPPSRGKLRGGCFAAVLRRALELWAGQRGGFLRQRVPNPGVQNPSVQALPCERIILSSSFPFACKCFSLKSTKPPLPSPSFKRTLLGFRRALFGFPALLCLLLELCFLTWSSGSFLTRV